MTIDYKDIRKKVDPLIDKKTASELGKSMADGFKQYMIGKEVPDRISNGVAAKGAAQGAAFVLAICANRHGLYTSNDMKITFLAYFDKMYDQYVRNMIETGDDENLR